MGQIERIERRLKLHDMRVLMSVVETGSMVKAAERLGTSQPAVSRCIADLERTLGVRLLERSPWGVEATQYGRAIIGRGVAVFDELRQGIKDIDFLPIRPRESFASDARRRSQPVRFWPWSTGSPAGTRAWPFTSRPASRRRSTAGSWSAPSKSPSRG
jgi:DNA-binding transcriptional LysR family regulator